jgi:hypothetical protein
MKYLATRDHLKVRRSKLEHMVPDPIEGAAHTFFSPAACGWLVQVWLERAGAALASRRTAVRESYDKACSSQYIHSLFAYSLLVCFEMLSSGRSIFHCSS